MSEICIRKAVPEFVGTVADMMQPVYAHAYPNDKGITVDAFEIPEFGSHLRDYLRKLIIATPSDLYVGFVGSKVMGSIGISILPETPEEGEIWGFYVSQECQGQGYGRLLWEDLMTRPEVMDLELQKLTVAKNLNRAIHFYEQEGFYYSGEQTWDWPSWTEPKGTNEYWLMEKQIN